ncbi:concanavalin A-like lectin/glucanase domain-containing protein [Paraphysoderma sedebokerense]|nr:concanavalin A-like lectin/glucanase domain-containing protein [Paraphysoderma sedebokerense]
MWRLPLTLVALVLALFYGAHSQGIRAPISVPNSLANRNYDYEDTVTFDFAGGELYRAKSTYDRTLQFKPREHSVGPFGLPSLCFNLTAFTAEPVDHNSIEQALSLSILPPTENERSTINSELAFSQPLLYGSFRTYVKLSPTKNTVFGFFYYVNDHSEIDIEYLSRDPGNIHFSLHSNSSGNSGKFVDPTIPKPLAGVADTEEWNEFRFDWNEDRIDFFVNGKGMHTITGPTVPRKPGLIMLNYWSDNSEWSGAPPTEKATMFVKNATFIFNYASSDASGLHNLNIAWCLSLLVVVFNAIL